MENEENKTAGLTEETAENTVSKTVVSEDAGPVAKEAEVSEEPKAEAEVPADSIDGEYNSDREQQTSMSGAAFRPMTYINDGTRTIDEDVERLRMTHDSAVKGAKVFDILTLVAMILSFGGVLAVTTLVKDESQKYIVWIVLGVAAGIILLSFILSIVFSRKRRKATEKYLHDYEEATNAYAIEDINVTDAALAVHGNFDDHLVVQAHYFATIENITTRGIVTGKRNDRDFALTEIAVSIPPMTFIAASAKPVDLLNLDGTKYVPNPANETLTGTTEIPSKDMTLLDLDLAGEVSGKDDTEIRRRDEMKAKKNQKMVANEISCGLFGKFFSYDMAVSSNEAMIITFMGDRETTVLPTHLTGFKAVKVPGLRSNIVVYVADVRFARSFLDEEGVKRLNAFNVDSNTVQWGFISINSYGSKVGLGLSTENLMTLPMKSLRHLGAFDAYKAAVDTTFSFIDYVGSKTATKEVR